jgi:hypothetical protein
VSRNQALIFVSASVLVGLLVGAFWIRTPGSTDSAIGDGSPDEAPGAALAGAVTLYFPGADGRLHTEVRALDTDAEGSELVRRIVASLLSGPDDDALFRPLPESTAVGSALLASDGTLYLDLISSEYSLPPVAGSQRELLAAYSLVNSVCANVPRIRGVALLWNSEQRTTFAGNLDTTRPLTPNRRLVAATS